MNKDFIYQFIRLHQLAVVSTVSLGNKPESALIGIAVSENSEIIFDTVRTSRKYQNIMQNRHVSLVIGWDNETTLQYEGEALALSVSGDKKDKEIYFSVFPEGRKRADTWPDIVHFKIIPKWIRFSNFNEPQLIDEMKF